MPASKDEPFLSDTTALGFAFQVPFHGRVGLRSHSTLPSIPRNTRIQTSKTNGVIL